MLEIKTCRKYGVRFVDTVGKTIALRADYDGLLYRRTNESWCIKNRCYACMDMMGIPMLLTLAKILYEVKDELKGKIVIVHQRMKKHRRWCKTND